MLADEVDYVIGVDTHRDQHTLAVVAAPTGAVLAKPSCAHGRAATRKLAFAAKHAGGARVWAVAGAGHYGAGLTRYLGERGETVLEVGRQPRQERRLRGKDDPLDAIRAARSGLAAEALSLRVWGRDRRRCGCCCSPGAAPSTRAGRHSSSCAA